MGYVDYANSYMMIGTQPLPATAEQGHPMKVTFSNVFDESSSTLTTAKPQIWISNTTRANQEKGMSLRASSRVGCSTIRRFRHARLLSRWRGGEVARFALKTDAVKVLRECQGRVHPDKIKDPVTPSEYTADACPIGTTTAATTARRDVL